MSSKIKDEEQLNDALQAVQRLYMKHKNKTNCIGFYAALIQPIYKEFEANDEAELQEQALQLPVVSGCLTKEQLHAELKEYAQWYQMDDLQRKTPERFDSIIDRYIVERK